MTLITNRSVGYAWTRNKKRIPQNDSCKKDWTSFFDGWTVIKTVMIQNSYLNEILAHTSKDDVLLEIGAGSGYSSLAIMFSGRRNVVVSDIDPEVLENIKRSMPCLNRDQIDMFDIGRPDGSVDCIFHQGLMEHFSDEEIIRSLTEQARVAKLVVWDVPNNRRWNKIQEYGNERFLSVKKWISLIEQSNLYLIKVTGRRLPKILKFFPHFLQSAELMKRVFGTSSIFVCGSKSHRKESRTCL